MKPLISIIVAAGHGGAIGVGGQLPFHISDDLKHFKQTTLGKPVVMGRKTFESLPGGALPGRRNIVVTRNGEWAASGVETAPSLDEAIALAASASPEEIMIIGGGQIYAQAIPLAGRIYLTEVDADCPGADTFFPTIDSETWQTTDASPIISSPIPHRFLTLDRK